MTYVLMLSFDKRTEETIRETRRVLVDIGVPVDIDDRPHMSLVSCGVLDVARAIDAARSIAKSSVPFSVSFTGIGSFLTAEGTVYLAPAVDDGLLNIQRRALAVFRQHGSEVNPYYAAGRWTPHCTIANRLDIDQRGAAMRVCAEHFSSFDADVVDLVLAEFGPGVSRVLASIPLKAEMVVIGLDHAQITIPQGTEEQGKAFYCDFLQLPEIDKPEALAGRGGFWLQIGDRQVHVGAENGFDRLSTKGHLAYAVAGLPLWRRHLESAGIEPLDGVPIPGFDRFEFRDPFGNRVELIESNEHHSIGKGEAL